MPDRAWVRHQRIGKYGKYRLEDCIGRGGCGEVWQAFDTELERDVAIKVLLPDPSATPVELRHDRERFLREARETARLGECPNIIAIFDYEEHAGRPYLVMPFVTGWTLREMIASGPMAPPDAVELVGQVADALAHAHAKDRIHRDVKPSNILVGGSRDQPHVRVSDFGIVGMTDAAGRITRTGMVLGSLAYMAPERLPVELGRIPPGATVGFDVYALACLLHECLTGRPAFDERADTEIQLYLTYARAHRVPARPRPSWADASLAPFDTVVVQGLAVDPVARPVSATSFADGMRSALVRWREQTERPTARTTSSYRAAPTRPSAAGAATTPRAPESGSEETTTPTVPDGASEPTVPTGASEPTEPTGAPDEPEDVPSSEWHARHGTAEPPGAGPDEASSAPSEAEPDSPRGSETEHEVAATAGPAAETEAVAEAVEPTPVAEEGTLVTEPAPTPPEAPTETAPPAESVPREPPAVSASEAPTEPEPTRVPRYSRWGTALLYGAGSGLAGCAVVAATGLGTVADVVVIAVSWAAGASIGLGVSGRSR